MFRRVIAATALLAAESAASAAVTGPRPYLAVADSPFPASAFTRFALDDFDSDTRTPGYTASTGLLLNFGSLIDSVGGSGGSWYSIGAHSVTFDFAPYRAAYGALPNRAGIVWTDVGYSDGEAPPGPFVGKGLVVFEAFDQNGASLGVRSGVLGDGLANGGTAEDRFFGAASAGGISRITLAMPNSGDWEMDHLQFGTAVPEPASWALLIAGFGLTGAVLRRRRPAAV